MDLVLRATVIYFVIFVITRAVGRRELSSLEPFDLIMLVVLGDLVQQGVTQDDYSVTGAIIVVATIAVLTVLLSFVSYRFPRTRPTLEGDPIVLVQDGEVLQRNARRERLTVEEILAEARQQQITSLDDVRWAVLETNGKISFIPRQGGG